ncbi:unnamed protein product, partial [Ixodes hexagonus]
MPENGLFLEPPVTRVPGRKKKRGPPDECRPRVPDLGSWATIFAPRDSNELAVNRKKVQEVERWLGSSLGEGVEGAPLLLLCGPAGAGKTATLVCLASQLGLALHQWASPPQSEWIPGRLGPVEAFECFLFQCSRYRPLVAGRSGRPLLLVEDLPNAFLRDAEGFHQVLRRYRSACRSPLVFVVSESSDNLEYRLFPRELVTQLGISKIAFNPVAPTSMCKALAAVADQAMVSQMLSQLPSQEDLDQIALSSAGDIRNAIHALQFLCSAARGGVKEPAAAKRAKRSKTAKRIQGVPTGGPTASRDSSLHLFHSLGKILYCKRDPSKMADSDRLPQHMAHLEQPPATEVPEVCQSAVQTKKDFSLSILLGLCEYSNFNSLTACAEERDCIIHEWAAEGKMVPFGVSLCTRGLMRDLRRPPSGWLPLEKPQWGLTASRVQKKLFEVKNAFRG